MHWNQVARTLRVVFFLRVPLVMLMVLAALGPLINSTSMTSNLLDQEGKSLSLFLVSFAAFMLAFTTVTALNLTLFYGRDRFEEMGHAHPKRPLLTFAIGCLAASILDGYVYTRTLPSSGWNVWFLLLGFLGAFVLVFVAKILQLTFTDPKTTPHPPPYLVFPAYLFGPLEGFFDYFYCLTWKPAESAKGFLNAVSQWPLSILQHAGQGYLIRRDASANQPLRLQSGHVFATSLAALAFASYFTIAYVKSTITANDAKVPALAFVLLFLIVACWSLSALAFFFDRYRFPLFSVLFVLSALTFAVPQSDHFFRVVKRSFPPPPTSAQYLATRLNGQKKRLIFVATPGGGIQAAAWTAKVLTELNNISQGEFRKSVAAISSVSGGSLGAIIYGASFNGGPVPPEKVPENATRSALDEVAWGWTVPDFWRTILPWLRTNRAIDRGWALEKKWAAVNGLKDQEGSPGTLLSDWSGIARQGKMPALLINSMIAERGQPVVFSNTQFPAGLPSDQGRIVNFYDLYKDHPRGSYDIRVNTAARLSASFSYVAPAPRPYLDAPFGEGFHFVDGGYYDNYGMNSLLSWLDEALADPRVRTNQPDILILQIRHFNPGALNGPILAGWGLQLIAPPLALYNMRDFAQSSVAQNQLAFFDRFYGTQKVNVWTTTIEYDGSQSCSDAPLSWKLDSGQIGCISQTWNNLVRDDPKRSLTCVADYINGRDPSKACARAGATKE
jgi:hypothetical protein